jgi:hypothetical protein
MKIYKKKMVFANGKVVASNEIPGGLADGKSIKDIAERHNVSVSCIEKQIAKGIVIEMEHTGDKSKAREIAMDHLYEIVDYYDRLAKMEGEAEE